jgi:hypothetical protein
MLHQPGVQSNQAEGSVYVSRNDAEHTLQHTTIEQNSPGFFPVRGVSCLCLFTSTSGSDAEPLARLARSSPRYARRPVPLPAPSPSPLLFWVFPRRGCFRLGTGAYMPGGRPPLTFRSAPDLPAESLEAALSNDGQPREESSSPWFPLSPLLLLRPWPTEMSSSLPACF